MARQTPAEAFLTERRTRRSDTLHEAVSLYLNAVRQRTGLQALALSTDSGEFVAGAGPVDVEWMGRVGASRRLRTLAWSEHTLHVMHLRINDVPMVLTAAGAQAPEPSSFERLGQILGH